METTSPVDPETEAKLTQIRQRLDDDPTFRQQAIGDLPGTLRAAGLPDEAMERFVAFPEGPDASDDVSGYMMCVFPVWKCWNESDGSKVCEKQYITV